jgi:hypothetical protein
MRDGANPLIFASSPILMTPPEKSVALEVDFKPKANFKVKPLRCDVVTRPPPDPLWERACSRWHQ